jgi:farnesol dehydrogenase
MKKDRGSIFVTGASGFLGGCLAKELNHQGFRLRLLLRNPQNTPLPASPTIQIVTGDITEPESYLPYLPGCAVVIHSAALVHNWAPNRRDFYRVNVIATENLLHSAIRCGVGRIVYTSSFLALGASDAKPLNETSPAPRYPAGNDYEQSKRMALESVHRLVRLGFPIITCIPGIIYGPGALTPGNYLVQLIRRRILGKDRFLPRMGGKIWNFSFIDDVVKGHLLALQKGKEGEQYILGGENATINKFFSLLEEKCGAPRPAMTLPFAIAKMRPLLFDQWYYPLVKKQEPPLTAGVLDIYSRNWAMSSEKAERELGYKWRGLSAGLDKTLTWMTAEELISRK